MGTEHPPEDELLDFLKKQIAQREAFRDEIENSIHILQEAARELRRSLPGPPAASGAAEEEEDLPYRIETGTRPAAGASMAEESRPTAVGPPSPAEAEARRPPSPELLEPEEGLPPATGLERLAPLQAHPSPVPPAPAGDEPEVPEEGAVPSALAEPFTPPTGAPPARTEDPYQKQVDDDLQEDQMRLLRIDDVTDSKRHTDGLPFAAGLDPAEEVSPAPPPAASPHRERPARKAPGSQPMSPALSRLMDYIRGGGAVRCNDPWGQICAAFVLRADGSAVFATDVFLNYIRKTIRHLRETYRSGVRAGGSLPPAVADEVKRHAAFLGALAGALEGRQTAALDAVPGLRIAGRERLPGTFEFERATDMLIRPEVFAELRRILARPAAEFFQKDGPYFQLAGFLGAYQNFTRRVPEEKRAASMLAQLDLPGGSAAPAAAAREEEVPTPDHAFAMAGEDNPFLEEAEDLQDLNTFDFSPDDQKTILAQQESAFSQTQFKRIARDSDGEGAAPPAAEDLPRASDETLLGPDSPRKKPSATPPAEEEEDPESIKKFLEDLGIEWND